MHPAPVAPRGVCREGLRWRCTYEPVAELVDGHVALPRSLPRWRTSSLCGCPINPVRTSRLVIVVLVTAAFVSGAVAGGLVASAAASRAAQVALRAARGWFVYDQEQRLARAWNAGDMSEALVHARCAYEAEYAEGGRWFDASAIGFSVWGGALLQAVVVEPNAATAEKVRPSLEGAAHARIAVVLERLGREKDAQDRLEEATKIGGRQPAWWRELGLQTVAVTLPEGFMRPDGTVRR